MVHASHAQTFKFTTQETHYFDKIKYKYSAVILLQIVMVSPGTHLVKNHESQLKKLVRN